MSEIDQVREIVREVIGSKMDSAVTVSDGRIKVVVAYKAGEFKKRRRANEKLIEAVAQALLKLRMAGLKAELGTGDQSGETAATIYVRPNLPLRP